MLNVILFFLRIEKYKVASCAKKRGVSIFVLLIFNFNRKHNIAYYYLTMGNLNIEVKEEMK